METLEPLTRVSIALAGIVSLPVLLAIFLIAARTRALPICWRCGFRSVRHSQSHRMFDNFARLCLLQPYRCDKCLLRYYRFPSHRALHSRGRSMAAGAGSQSR